MKKKQMLLVGIVILIVVGLFFMIPSENNPIIKENDTIIEPIEDIYAKHYVLEDSYYNSLTRYKNDARLSDGKLQFMVNADEDLDILFSTVAIQNLGLNIGWQPLLRVNTFAPFFEVRDTDALQYNKLYFYIPKVNVTVDGEIHEAIMPTDRLTIEGEFIELFYQNNTFARLTFLEDNETTFKTIEGQYVYAPKINIEVFRGADFEVVEGYVTTMVNETLWTNITVGMDIHGNMMSGYKIYADKELSYNDGILSYI